METLPNEGDVTVPTLELLWRAAPEQVAELDELFAQTIQARLSKGLGPQLGVTYNVLLIPEVMLKQLWLSAHAAWQHFLGFDAVKKGKDGHPFRSVAQSAIGAAQQLSNGEAADWPNEVPIFGQATDGLHAKATRELYAMAVAWAIAHEMQHAKFYEDTNRPSNLVAEEVACDEYAAGLLFDKISAYCELTGEPADKVRDKRAMSALVGLYFVAMLSPESGKLNHIPLYLIESNYFSTSRIVNQVKAFGPLLPDCSGESKRALQPFPYLSQIHPASNSHTSHLRKPLGVR